MTLHSDIPSHVQIERLLRQRSPASVSIYLTTNRITQDAQNDRLVLSGAKTAALEQLRSSGAEAANSTAIESGLDDLIDDDLFWTRQADSLAVFSNPEHVEAYRLPNRLSHAVEVSDRFHVKPLLRAVTFPQAAYILALAKGDVRLLEILPDGPPNEVLVPELPRDAWDPRSNNVFKARERNYVRQIDHALRGVLNGSDLPLILAATETVAALYRTVNTYPHLADARWPGNPEKVSDDQLSADAREILDDLYATQLAETVGLFDLRASQGRAATDVSDVARLATMGAVDTVLVDIDASVPGMIDEHSGAVQFAESPDSYGVLDEICRRVYLNGGRVLAVRTEEIPGAGIVAAILRFAV